MLNHVLNTYIGTDSMPAALTGLATPAMAVVATGQMVGGSPAIAGARYSAGEADASVSRIRGSTQPPFLPSSS